ncbi:MAG: rRNA maturation RNase YbeY [Rhodocyclaceae bacterium]
MPASSALPPARLDLQVQRALKASDLPSRRQLHDWIRVLGSGAGAITIRFVDEAEGSELNEAWRGKAYPTNVLSFPYETEPVLMGDLVLCWPVVLREAAEQGKTVEAHCAHLVIHGVLHLCGHDHELGEAEAAEMERIEQDAMAKLGYPDPYA